MIHQFFVQESLVSSFERSTESVTAMMSTPKDEYQAWADFAAATLRKLDAGTARNLMSQATVMFLTPDIAPKQI